MKINDIVDLYTMHAGDWGGNSTVYRFDAIKDGKVVKSVTKAPMTKGCMDVKISNTTLTERESYDVAALRIRAVDENENLLCFSSEPIKINVEGPVEIIGPSMIALRGGMGGAYLKTTGKGGKASVTLESHSLGVVKINLDVIIDR